MMREPADHVAFALAVLKNVGIDTECGACMEVAFTGRTTHAHECARGTATPTPVVVQTQRVRKVFTRPIRPTVPPPGHHEGRCEP